jgi:hypothetical protein
MFLYARNLLRLRLSKVRCLTFSSAAAQKRLLVSLPYTLCRRSGLPDGQFVLPFAKYVIAIQPNKPQHLYASINDRYKSLTGF